MAVAPEEAFEPQQIVKARRRDDHGTGAGFDQADPAQDQRPHDALAEIGFRDHQPTKPFGRNQQGRHGADRAHIDESRAAGELADLAHEMACTLAHDQMFDARRVAMGDRDLAGKDQQQAGREPAGRDDRRAIGIGDARGEALDAGDIRRREEREGLIAAGFDGRWHVRCSARSAAGRPVSVMRRRGFRRGQARARLDDLVEFGLEPVIAPREPVDLLPLRGNHGVQLLDRAFLKSGTGFEVVDPGDEVLGGVGAHNLSLAQGAATSRWRFISAATASTSSAALLPGKVSMTVEPRPIVEPKATRLPMRASSVSAPNSASLAII